MNTIFKQGLFLLLLLLFSQTCLAAESPSPTNQAFHLTGQVTSFNIPGGLFYGVLGDDGIKYQPVNLPRKFKKEGAIIQFDAQPKANVMSAFQWGTIVELSNVAQASPALSSEERKAIHVLLKRLHAFNIKDLAELKEVDVIARALTKEQFISWVDNYNNFTLLYVEITESDSTAITGFCYYTRELVNGMTLHGNTDLAAMTFTISQTSNGWKLTASGPLSGPITGYNGDALTALKQQAAAKYATSDLAALWH